jgi:hypothetical protein
MGGGAVNFLKRYAFSRDFSLAYETN